MKPRKSLAVWVKTEPGINPGQRFRIEQYLSFFAAEGIDVHFMPAIKARDFQRLYKPGRHFRKALIVLRAIFRRFYQLGVLLYQDIQVVYILREALPLGPPIFEWLITKLGKCIIFDYDDAIWLNQTSQANWIIKFFRPPNKTAKIISYAKLITPGNTYLAEYATAIGAKQVMVIPTVIDHLHYHNRLKQHQSTDKLVIGWTGTFSTLPYLLDIMPALKQLEEVIDFQLLIICNQRPDIELHDWVYIEWSDKTEIEDLLQFDVGLMPLPNNEWTRGKCGFKAIQYMALGIPALVSPVSVNATIVDHEVNGYHCESAADWVYYLKLLALDTEKRARLGLAARNKMITHYSVGANQQKMKQAIKDCSV